MRRPKNPFSSDEPAEDDALEWSRDRRDLTADEAPGRDAATPPPLPRRTGDSGFRPHGGQAAGPQEFWPLTDPEYSWPLAPRPEAAPADSWAPAGPEDSWAAADPRQADPRDAWAPGDLRDEWVQGGVAEPGMTRAPQSRDPQDEWAQSDSPDRARSDAGDQWAQSNFGDQWVQSDPRDEWVAGSRDEPWAARGPQPADPRDEWGQGDLRDEWAQASPGEPWAPRDPQRAGSRDEWADAGPEDYWDAPAPPRTDPRDDWGQGGPDEPWTATGLPPGEPPGAWGEAAAQDSWSPDSRPQAAPRDPWRPPPVRDDRAAGGPGGGEPGGGEPGGGEHWEDERPRPEPIPAAEAGQAPARQPRQEGDPAAAEPAPASMGFQDLWESWEPPYDPIGAISEPVRHPTAPYPELVRDAEYEEELGLWEAPGSGGPGGGEPYGGEPSYPEPRRRAQHARQARRPRMNGAFLVLAGALALAGAIPLGILGARTLGHHGNTALRTAPLSESHAAASAPGPNGAPAFSALAGPGCTPATGASVFPYHPVNGDDWFTGTASASGPCGRSFSYVYLAMVPGNPDAWRDHYAWVFHTGMGNPSCTFSLYIPAAPQANSISYYWFSAGDSNAVDRIADFTIDQATHQGQWVTKGPFTFPGGTVLIEATDRGEGALTASVAVGPARLSC